MEAIKGDLSGAPNVQGPGGYGSGSGNPFAGYEGYCTWGAWEKAQWLGHAVTGNAQDWAAQAQGAGLSVGVKPAVDAVYVRLSPGVGHVAVVTKVLNATTFEVVEMNGGRGATAQNDWKTDEFGQYATNRVKYTGDNVRFIYKPGGTTPPNSTDSTPPAGVVPGQQPSLYKIYYGGSTGSGKAEVYKLAGDGFGSYLSQGSTAEGINEPGTTHYRLGDFNGDGANDLYKIYYGGPTGSGKTEVYVMDGKTGFSTYLSGGAIAEGINQPNTADYELGDFNRDGTLDLYKIYYGGPTGSGKAEVYVMDGKTKFTTYLSGGPTSEGTNQPGQADWDIADFNRDGVLDLWKIFYAGATGSGKAEVYVLDGKTNFTSYLFGGPTAEGINQPGQADWEVADYNNDGSLDLYKVFYGGPTASGHAEVYVLDGKSEFKTYLKQATTPEGINQPFTASWVVAG